MVCSQLANFHFQMGVTIMGFAEHFKHCHNHVKNLQAFENDVKFMVILLTSATEKYIEIFEQDPLFILHAISTFAKLIQLNTSIKPH